MVESEKIMKRDERGYQHQVYPQTHVDAVIGLKPLLTEHGVGQDGKDGKDGTDGKNGANGMSSYEIALSYGFVGTEKDWLDSLSAGIDPSKDYYFLGKIKADKEISGDISGKSFSAKNILTNLPKKIVSTSTSSQSFNTLNIDYVQKIHAGNFAKQNAWISHVTGYTYVVGHVNSPEDTVILEVTPAGTVVSSMLIKSDGTNNIHGQNVVFDTEYEGIYPRIYEWYVDANIRMVIYQPNMTINYLDMQVASSIPNTTVGHSFGIDFKNKRFSFWNGTLDEVNKTYQITIYSYNIDSMAYDGSFSLQTNIYYAKSTINLPYSTSSNPYIVQGVAVIPKISLTKKIEDANLSTTIVFVGSAIDVAVPETSTYPYEILFFDSDGVSETHYSGNLDNLKNIFRPVTSQKETYRWPVNYTSDNTPLEMTEMESGNVIKTSDGEYGFTFLMLTSKGSESSEAFLFGSIPDRALNRIRYAEMSASLTKTKRVEPTETMLSNIVEIGTYDIWSANFNSTIIDKPQIFVGKDISLINGVTSYYSGIQMEVARQSVRGMVTQKLTIYSASSGPIRFERIVTPSYQSYGSLFKKVNLVTPWQYIVESYETKNASHAIVAALGLTSNLFNTKGMGSYIDSTTLKTFDGTLAKLAVNKAGWFLNEYIGSNKLNNTDESYIQTFTTFDQVNGPSVFKRTITVTSVGVNDVFTSGYGGGSMFKSASPWIFVGGFKSV